MKLKISGGGHKFGLRLPLGLVCNGLTSLIAVKVLNRYSPVKLSYSQVNGLFSEVLSVKRRYRGMVIFSVQSKNGEYVELRL